MGHSYGGDVALQLAQDTPGVVHSLALLEPGLMVGASAQGSVDCLAVNSAGPPSGREATVTLVACALPGPDLLG